MLWDDCHIKLVSVAGTRANMAKVFSGHCVDKTPDYEIDAAGERKRKGLDSAQKTCEDENNRALAELVVAMPRRKLTKIVSRAKSDAFPEGCAHTAILELKNEMGLFIFEALNKCRAISLANIVAE